MFKKKVKTDVKINKKTKLVEKKKKSDIGAAILFLAPIYWIYDIYTDTNGIFVGYEFI